MRWFRRRIHRAIVWYLRRCGGAFHSFPYGADGRYVVLMNEEQYHRHEARITRPSLKIRATGLLEEEQA